MDWRDVARRFSYLDAALGPESGAADSLGANYASLDPALLEGGTPPAPPLLQGPRQLTPGERAAQGLIQGQIDQHIRGPIHDWLGEKVDQGIDWLNTGPVGTFARNTANTVGQALMAPVRPLGQALGVPQSWLPAQPRAPRSTGPLYPQSTVAGSGPAALPPTLTQSLRGGQQQPSPAGNPIPWGRAQGPPLPSNPTGQSPVTPSPTTTPSAGVGQPPAQMTQPQGPPPPPPPPASPVGSLPAAPLFQMGALRDPQQSHQALSMAASTVPRPEQPEQPPGMLEQSVDYYRDNFETDPIQSLQNMLDPRTHLRHPALRAKPGGSSPDWAGLIQGVLGE